MYRYPIHSAIVITCMSVMNDNVQNRNDKTASDLAKRSNLSRTRRWYSSWSRLPDQVGIIARGANNITSNVVHNPRLLHYLHTLV